MPDCYSYASPDRLRLNALPPPSYTGRGPSFEQGRTDPTCPGGRLLVDETELVSVFEDFGNDDSTFNQRGARVSHRMADGEACFQGPLRGAARACPN
jgi:hypothetical protein